MITYTTRIYETPEGWFHKSVGSDGSESDSIGPFKTRQECEDDADFWDKEDK